MSAYLVDFGACFALILFRIANKCKEQVVPASSLFESDKQTNACEGSHYSSVAPSAPTILRPRFDPQPLHLHFFNLYLICDEKRTKTNKKAGICRFKKTNTWKRKVCCHCCCCMLYLPIKREQIALVTGKEKGSRVNSPTSKQNH